MNFCYFSPLEKAWSYKCVGDRCIREHYTPGTKRIPFMSCAMICGTSHIWPMPTGKVSLSSRSLTFQSNQLQFDVKTTFSEAKQLLNSSYNVFLFDLKSLEGQPVHTTTPSDLDTYNNEIIGEKSATEHGPKADSANANENASPNCDIQKFIINAEIQTIGDVFLHMETDESYELNVTSKCKISDTFRTFNKFFFYWFSLLIICRRQWKYKYSFESEIVFWC